jgi:cobalamin biosynthesis Mg chelatase CobN
MFVSFGCKTVKQTEKTKAEVKTAANLTVKESNNANIDIASTFSKVERNIEKEWITDNSTVDEVSDETTTTTNLSAPDSTGKQYPTSTSTTNKHTHRGVHNNVKKNAESNNSRDIKGGVSENSDYKSDKSVKDKGKQSIKAQTDNKITEETKTPAWVYVVVFVSFLILIGIIYALLKRFGIIK